MIRDIKRNSQGIIISTQLDDMGEDYSYIELQKSVRKFNRNANNSSDSNFNEVYDDRITDIQFDELIISNTYTFVDTVNGREISPNETDPAFFILEQNPNITENIPDEDVDGVGSVGGTTTSAGGSTGMLNPASGGSGGMMNPNNVSGSAPTFFPTPTGSSNPNNVSGSGGVFVGGSSGDGSSGDSSGAILFPFGVIGQYQNELRIDTS